MLRSVMPMISAACIHVISPPIARVITSLIFIARSKARIGYNGIHSQPPMWTRTYSDPVPRPDISFATSTGQIMCYRHGPTGTLTLSLPECYKKRDGGKKRWPGTRFQGPGHSELDHPVLREFR